MALVQIKLVERVKTVFAAACVESELAPASVLHINLDVAVFHSDVGELLADQGQ